MNNKIYTIIVGILVGIIVNVYQFENPVMVIIILSIAGVMMMSIIPNFITIYFTKDMGRVSKYLEKSKNPIYNFYYAIANDNEIEVENALKKIDKKYKNTKWSSLFRVLHAHYKRDFAFIHNQLNNIKIKSFKAYYESLIEIENGNFKKAQDMAINLSKPWMVKVVLSELSIKKGDIEEAKMHLDKAIEMTRGMQRYSLISHKNRIGETMNEIANEKIH
ncbi:hypothetical protein [Chengkuizengella axinellae]|uniref:Tetratricopeptide repeat protein n=1 Tax=Chengkuizengella axinellae TaxID=3064388 RepID=A0ABT9J8D5_9BACL|nr:hypothetical protein [Chengkuizengella sp. 2205SS18-9]MDP5277184.1 hypothetical protein [Chengkuizengella sp. 2205SS18-9]